ncbi:MAG: DUF5063 domain-containing protein [Chloroflexia bacterium]
MSREANGTRDQEGVRRFVEVTERFCGLVEGHEELSQYQLVRRAAEVLPELYAAGLGLPDAEMPEAPSDKPDAFYDSVPIKHTAALARAMGDKLGSYNAYWQALEPFEDEQPAAVTLGEDLADMYGDLKRGLIARSKGTERDAVEAVWHWRFSFANHWGRHLVGAMRALHYALFDYGLSEDSGR